MGLWSRIKKAFSTDVNIKKYTKVKTVKPKRVTKQKKKNADVNTASASPSRKGRSDTKPVKQTVKKAEKTGQRKAAEQKQYLNWKKAQPEVKKQMAKANPISVKRNRAQLQKANIPHTTAVGDSGKREAYKSTKDFYQKNPKTTKVRTDAIKDEYKYGNKAVRGAADRILENLGMGSKAKQADELMGTKVSESKEVRKAKKSKEYEAGQFVGDIASFAVPGAAEGTVAKGLLKGGKVATKVVKAGIRGGKAVTKAEKTAAKAVIKNQKAAKFAAERAADAMTSAPMNLASASSDSKDGKETLKKFALNTAGDVAMGSAVSAIKAGKGRFKPEIREKSAKIDVKTQKTDVKTQKENYAKANKTTRKLKTLKEKKELYRKELSRRRPSTLDKSQYESLRDIPMKDVLADISRQQENRVVWSKSGARIKKARKAEEPVFQKNVERNPDNEVIGEERYVTKGDVESTKGKVAFKKPEVYSKYKSNDKKTVKETFDEVKFRIREGLIDKNAGIQDFVKNTGGKKSASAAISATDSTKARVDYNLTKEQRNYAGTKKIGPSVKEIFDKTRTRDDEWNKDLADYTMNKANLSRAKHGTDMFGDLNNPMKAHDRSKAIVKALEEKHKGDKLFFDTADNTFNFSKNQIYKYVDSGMMSKEQAEYYLKKNPYHVTSYRDMEDTVHSVDDVLDKDKKASSVGAVAAKGSDRYNILSPEQQLMLEENRVTYKADINNMLREIAQGENVITGSEQALSLLQKDFEQVFPVEITEKGMYRIGFLDNGVRKFMLVDERAGKEIVRLIKHEELRTPLLEKTTGKAVEGLRLLSTTYSPVFPVKNGIRDLSTAPINSKNADAWSQELIPALRSIIANDDEYKLFQASGGGMSNIVYKDKAVSEQTRMAMADLIEKAIKGENVRADIVKNAFAGTFRKAVDGIEYFNTVVESLARYAEFRAVGNKILKNKGVNDISALTKADVNTMLNASAEISVNFARSGYYGKWINRNFVPFFNAGVQGVSREYRLLEGAVKSKDFKRAFPLILKLSALGIAPALLNEIVVSCSDEKTEREYNEIDEFKRLQNYYYKVGDTWIQIPAGRLNAIVGMASKLAANSKNYSFKQAFKTAMELSAPSNVFTDNIFSPLVRSLNNKTWYGSNIVSESQMRQIKDGKLKPSDVYDETTSAYAKLFGKTYVADHFGVTPKQIDAILDQYGGSWAKMLHTATQKKSQINNPLVQQIIDAFSVDPVAKNSLQSKYYKKLEEIGRKKSKDSEEYKELQKYSYRLYDINDAIAEIQSKKDFDKNDALKVRSLQKYRNKITREAIEGKKLKRGYEADDLSIIREKVDNDKFVAEKIRKWNTKVDEVLKGGYKNYSKLLDVHEDSLTFDKSNKSYALALAKNNADRKLVYLYGVSQDDIREAKKLVSHGVSYDGLSKYYSTLEKTRKNMGITGSYTPKYVEYLALKRAGSDKSLTDFISAGTPNSRNYHRRKLNAAFAAAESGLTDKDLSKARKQANSGRKKNPKDYLTDADEATKYVEKHYGDKPKRFKAIMWESVCNSYFADGKNPYGEVENAKIGKPKAKFKPKNKVKEISSDMPTVFGGGRYTKKQKNTLANKAFLRDNLAVVNKAKAVANGKGSLDAFIKEVDKQSGKNGVTRQTRSYFREQKPYKESAETTSSETGRSGYRSYGKSGYRSYGKSGYGSSGRRSGRSSSGSGISQSEVKFDWQKNPSARKPSNGKKTKDYGLTDSEIMKIYEQMKNKYGEKVAKAYILPISTKL